MADLGEQITTLEARLKQLKAKRIAKATRKRAIDLRRERRDELRRKILVGAVVLQRIEAGEFDRAQLWGWLDPVLTLKEDRELFEGLRSAEEGHSSGNGEPEGAE